MLSESQLRGQVSAWRSAANEHDVFGPLPDDPAEAQDALSRAYRRLALEVHPDRYAHDVTLRVLAHSATVELNSWRARAENAIRRRKKSGGASQNTDKLTALGTTWIVQRPLATGDISDVLLAFNADAPDDDYVVFKVSRNKANHDLLDHEAKVLQQLWAASPDDLRTFGPYLPEYRGRFELADSRRANVLGRAEGFVSLAEVIDAYPDGVDNKTVVWMWNRALEVLAWVHQRGFVHAAVLPPHLLIHPVTHGGKLIDWSYAIDRNDRFSKQHVGALSKPYRRWYPSEVFDKEPATPSLDLYLLARTMIAVAGGDARRGELPDGFPTPHADLLRACLLPRAEDRFRDAFELYDRVRQASLRVYGPPRYHPFVMP